MVLGAGICPFSPEMRSLRAVLALWAACAQNESRPRPPAAAPSSPSLHTPLPLQPLALDGVQVPLRNLLIGLPLVFPELNIPPPKLTGHGLAPPHAWPPQCPFSFLWRALGKKAGEGCPGSAHGTLSPPTQGQCHRGRWTRADGAEGHAGPDLHLPVLPRGHQSSGNGQHRGHSLLLLPG